MKRVQWSRIAAVWVTALTTVASASAQIPGAATATATGTAAGVAPADAATAAGAAAKMGPLKKFCNTIDECKRKICKTPAGVLINNMTKPLTTMTGGVIPSCCPVMPTDEDTKKPGVAGAADTAKKDALEAKARQAAVKYLGTLDCRYYPDAAPALAAALRMDGNECVRFEAAKVLGRGCCCTQKTIDALEACVSGTEKDGNPAERSTRVRCAAALALDRCSSCYSPPPPEEEPKPKGEVEAPTGEKLPDSMPKDGKDGKDGKESRKTLPPGSRLPDAASIERARKTLSAFQARLASSPMDRSTTRPSDVSIYAIVMESANTPVESTPAINPTIDMKMTMESIPSVMPEARKEVITRKTESVPTPMPAKSNIPAPMPAKVVIEAKPAPVVVNAAPVKPAPVVTMPEVRQTAKVVPAGDIKKYVTGVLGGASTAERHAAIRELVKFDWKENPDVCKALITGARYDAVPAVRVDCIRHLAAYNMQQPNVISALESLADDDDKWVVDEAAKATSKLRDIQPAGR